MMLAPFPPRRDGRDGGARNIARRLELLTRDHEVSLLYLRLPGDPPLEAELERACATVISVDRGSSEETRVFDGGRRGSAKILWRAWRGSPLWSQALASSAAQDAASRLVANFVPEIIQVEYQIMGQFVPAGHDAACVLVIHEPAQCIAENFAATRVGLNRLLSLVDRRAWIRFERRIADESDQVIVFSPEDAAMVQTATPLEVVPLVVSLPAEPASLANEDPSTVLFVGNYGHQPNVDAAFWLVREIFPRVRARHAAARLWIVGDNPPPELVALSSDAVEVTGGVGRVEPWLERAAVFVAPIRTGGGMRVKVVEALAAGKPVVCTSRAIAGISLVGDEVRVAETAEALADELCALLDAPADRAELARRARAWAVRALGSDSDARAHREIYERLISRAPRRGGE